MRRGKSVNGPRPSRGRGVFAGFTLIELLVVLAVLAILASLVAPQYLDRIDDARETVLRKNLVGLREAVDLFYRDKGRYPKDLKELVDARYIRAVPEDPMTGGTDSWVIVPPVAGQREGVFDVKSGSPERARDGTPFAQW